MAAEGTAEALLAARIAEQIAAETRSRVARVIAEAGRHAELDLEQLEELIAAGLRSLDGLEETVLALVSLEMDAAAVFTAARPLRVEFHDVTAEAG